jgi:hypothetical protein
MSGKNQKKHSFPVRYPGKPLIRVAVRHSNKTLLFLFAALTFRRSMMRSIIRSSLQVGSRDLKEQLAPRKNAKAP